MYIRLIHFVCTVAINPKMTVCISIIENFIFTVPSFNVMELVVDNIIQGDEIRFIKHLTHEFCRTIKSYWSTERSKQIVDETDYRLVLTDREFRSESSGKKKVTFKNT